MRSMMKGNKKGNKKFRTSEKVALSVLRAELTTLWAVQVERATLEQQKFQYLYEQGDMLHMMDPDTYEMIETPVDVAGKMRELLTEGQTVELELYEGEPLSMLVPQSIDAEVVEMTHNGGTHLAILKNGMTISTPQHIQLGDMIKVRTEDWTFAKKA